MILSSLVVFLCTPVFLTLYKIYNLVYFLSEVSTHCRLNAIRTLSLFKSMNSHLLASRELQALRVLKDFDLLSEMHCLFGTALHKPVFLQLLAASSGVLQCLGNRGLFPVCREVQPFIHACYIWHLVLVIEMSLLIKARWQYLIWPQCPLKMSFLLSPVLGISSGWLKRKKQLRLYENENGCIFCW